MALYIIGLGLEDQTDITLKGKELIEKADIVYIENYTSLLQCTLHDLAKFYNKELIIADRTTSENGDQKIINEAKKQNVAFLVIGDSLSATTHIDLFKLAKEQGVDVQVVHNASVLTAIGATGLQLYKFGKTTSIPFIEDHPNLETPYHILKQNQELGAHTLFLLDLKPHLQKFMTVPEAITILQQIETKLEENILSKDTKAIGCARLGTKTQLIKSGTLKELKELDFGAPPHCLIIPGKLHFVEEEMLDLWK